MTKLQSHPRNDDLARCRVLVVGDAMLDRYWFGAVERISPEAPVPIVKVAQEEERLGGAANVALNIKSLGARPTLMTVIGNDGPASTLQLLLEKSGVDSILGRDDSLATTVKLRLIARSQQLLRADFDSVPASEVLLKMLSSFEGILPDFDTILFSDYGKGGLTHIEQMVKLARSANKPVLVDPKGNDYTRYRGVTVITPNKSELAQVIGQWRDEEDLHQRAHQLREDLALQAILLTRSEEGMTLFDDVDGKPSRLDVPAQAREVFDVTGAGDTVIATLSAMLGCGMSLRNAVSIATRAGSIVVGKFGAANVSYQELFE